MRHLLLVATTWALASGPGLAFEPMSGCFVAEAACPAVLSIRRGTNPGDVATQPDRSYRLLGANAEDATHFQIRIEEANPPDRWVGTGCGRTVATCGSPHAPPGEEPQVEPASAAENVLAASWQPAFCETHRNEPECRDQTRERFDASHFALHGLWPQPRGNDYCGVSHALEETDGAGRWQDLPPVDLGADLRGQLERVMPGTTSHLHRHEWIKHGTCYGASAKEYFADSLQLMAELNESPVRVLFAERIGSRVSVAEVRTSFDRGFGEGAGARVQMICDEGMIVELRLNLAGEITPDATLADLLAAAAPAPAGCRAGHVDAAGLAR